MRRDHDEMKNLRTKVKYENKNKLKKLNV